MAAPRIVPSDSMLRKYVERGLTHQQIADLITKETGVPVARSTISAALSRAGLTQRVRYDSVIPWPKIKAVHNRHYALTQLRTKARMDAGLKVTEEQRKRFESWRDRLFEENAICVYLIDSEDGFYYVRRKPSDGDSLVRYP